MSQWPYRGLSLMAFLAFLVLVVDPRTGDVGNAAAQLTPTPLPQPGEGTKPSGVAEQAEEGADKLPTTPVIPQAKSQRKRFELFELDGYFRVRTDWMKNFNLDFDDLGAGGAPFPRALACHSTDANILADDCSDTLKSANMRLRLEPTINVNETTQVYLQVDVLDNLVLGSTPDSLGLGLGRADIPASGLTGGQLPPEAGRNSLRDSILVKRAWAEVETSLGQVSFGRMPWHWGVGIYANAGGADPFSDTYDLDSDFGDTVDRVMFRAEIPGTRIDAAIATDWSSTHPVASDLPLFTSRVVGQPWDLEDNDDVSTWVVMLTRFDTPKIFNEMVARGDLAANYGAFLAYRTQKNDHSLVAEEDEDGGETLTDILVRRGLKTYTPNVWLRLGLNKIRFELEATAVIGSIEQASDIVLDPDPDGDPDTADAERLNAETELDIRQFGGVARLSYRALQDKMRFGLEVGYASGDQWDNQQPGETHISNARPLAVGVGDTTITNFFFDPDHHVDLILFRELIGTVTNATYVKPSLEYDFTSEIKVRASAIVSFANKKAATPGNNRMYGAELNGDLGYHRGGFFGGVSYGILFPFGALEHQDADVFGTNVNDAANAQTIQTRLVLRF